MGTNFEDVGDFHSKYGLPRAGKLLPHLLPPNAQKFRENFLQEELDEFIRAWTFEDLPGAFDALLDLVYVALGTAHMMGLPWQEGWDEVQRANMTKVRAASAEDARGKRGSALDVVKPEGWLPPDLEGVLNRYVNA